MSQFLKNFIGFFHGYGYCDCGDTLWNNSGNPGIDNGHGGGRIICDKCYLKNKIEIDENNRRVGGLDIKNRDCKHDWQLQSPARWWCPKCDSVMALSCMHGGSIACPDCANEWEQRQKKELKEIKK